MYKHIFNDNDYREDFMSKTPLTEVDFKQLLDNFFIINDQIYSMLRKLIKEKATYIPTENDRVNFLKDDPLIKKQFSKKRETDSIETVKLLFDNITSEQCIDFYRIFINF